MVPSPHWSHPPHAHSAVRTGSAQGDGIPCLS
ncbi:hypothetical protein N798_00345 [Knoellia flava TL1]|uniref:Uncharacterized protein n=1 Tax=Knoellia flava TL1 TaxID=1385518 RepID=A0ABR4XIN9_9MICO|nr:hypothetical protein N798_00345 [Knoellia flava TL1]